MVVPTRARSPAWQRHALVIALLAASACRADLDPSDSGVGSDSDSDSGAGSTGGADGPNLLANPSFENWLGDSPEVWGLDSVAGQRVDDGTDGSYAVEIDATGYGSVSQAVTPPDPLPLGTCLHAGASIKWVSGATQPPAFLMTATFVDDTEMLLGEQLGWVTNGEWHESAKVVQLPADTRTLAVSIGNSEVNPQQYRLDAASLRVGPCG